MKKKVIAISSGGGHWVQMLRLKSVLLEFDTTWVTVQEEYQSQIPSGQKFVCITDATRWSRWDLLKMFFQVWWLIIRTRPNVVISTGAAPGIVAIQAGKMLGAKTIWIDSIANVEQMSMSGKHARRWADLWLTQWPHLERVDGPKYLGAVL